MRRRSPRGQHVSEGLLGRVDRAAGEINPFLIVIAIGLVVLNLIGLAFLAPHLMVTRQGRGGGFARATAAAPPSRLGGLQ